MAESYSVEAVLKASGAKEFGKAFEGVSKQVGNFERSTKGVGGHISSMFSGVGKIAAGIGITKALAAGFNVLSNSVAGAVSRVDTLNRFPKMMEQMGFSAEESQSSIDKLSEGIQGLPTTLDSVAATAQQLAILTGDLDGATETTLALNNAFLSSGASTADAERGLQQYTQMLSKGTVDMQSWRTLQETMGVALNDVAKAFGFAGESAQNDLYAALQDGSITFDEFNGKLVEIDQSTGGFADRAKTASAGIATSFQNIKTAVVTGIANAIQSVDEAMQAGGFGSISDNLDKVKTAVQNAFKAITDNIPVVIEGLLGLYDTITTSTAFQTFSELLQTVLEKFNEIKQSFLESEAFENIKQLFSDLGQAILDINFVQLATDIQAFIDKWSPLILGITGAFVAFKLITGVITIVTGVMTLLSGAGTVLAGVIAFLTSPIGLVVVAIGIIIAIGVLLYKNWDTVKAKASELGGKISEVWNNIKAWTSNAWESIKTSISNAVTTAWNTVVEKFNSIKTSISTAVSNAATSVSNKFTEIKTTISNKIEEAKSAVSRKFEEIVSSISEKMNSAVQTVSDIGAGIKDFFDGIDLYASGKAIIQSAIDGLVAMKDKITGKVSEIAGAVRDFWPFSPAKDGPLSDIHKMDFAGPIGTSIDKARNPIKKSMSGLAGLARDSFNPNLDISQNARGFSGSVNSRVDHIVSDNLNNGGSQPAEINLNIGGKVYRAFVADISNSQNSQAQLTEAYL